MDKKKFNSESFVYIEAHDRFINQVEADFLINFLKNIPIEKLKELVNFSKKDPRKMQVLNQEQAEERNELEYRRCVKLKANLTI